MSSTTSDGAPLALRFFREGDETTMLRVLQGAFPAWPAVEIGVDPIDHLRWKLRSHEQALQTHFVIEDGGEIIGSESFLAQHAKIGDQIALTCHVGDVCVRPDHQGRGALLQMYMFIMPQLRESYDAHLVFRPRNRSSAVVRQGDTRPIPFANQVHALVRPLRPWPASGGLSKAPRQLVAWARAALGDLPAPKQMVEPWELRQVPRFDERIDALWDEASRPFHFIVARDRERLNWRYADPRAGLFMLRLAEQDGRILGYSVLRVSHGTGHIADLLVLPGRVDVLCSLLRDALAIFRSQGLAKVEVWCATHHPYRETLRRCGFLLKWRTVPLTLNIYHPERFDPAFLSDRRAAIHLMAGDTDLV